MIDSIFGSLFRCSHSRLTRPITPVSKPGVPSGDTYVVCLDCGKQFSYDWDKMRVGKPIDRSAETGVLHPEMPGPVKHKFKYALLGSAVPLAILLGRGFVKRRRATAGTKSGSDVRYIDLPRGGPGARFRVDELLEHIERSGRSYIIRGEVDCAFADHPRPSSLDYWLRENFAKNKDLRQATDEVVRQLLATGSFEESDHLRCPDTGERSRGFKAVGLN